MQTTGWRGIFCAEWLPLADWACCSGRVRHGRRCQKFSPLTTRSRRRPLHENPLSYTLQICSILPDDARIARAPRSHAEYRWSQCKALVFIEALARHRKVAAAARAVGLTRQSAYCLRDRVPAVAEVWARAQDVGRARRCGGRPGAAAAAPKGDGFGAARRRFRAAKATLLAARRRF